MTDNGLIRYLPSHTSPLQWYKLLNNKVFFWVTRDRLLRLLNAGAYRLKEHDVLEAEARPLFKMSRKKIWLCSINSGCTKPFPHPRDEKTFFRIGGYPYAQWKKREGVQSEQ